MPWTAQQKKAMYAEIERRKKGEKPKMFLSMSLAKLEQEVKKPTKRGV